MQGRRGRRGVIGVVVGDDIDNHMPLSLVQFGRQEPTSEACSSVIYWRVADGVLDSDVVVVSMENTQDSVLFDQIVKTSPVGC
ncbi:hypothetical protein D3C81_1755040 [compost metagenome]